MLEEEQASKEVKALRVDLSAMMGHIEVSLTNLVADPFLGVIYNYLCRV